MCLSAAAVAVQNTFIQEKYSQTSLTFEKYIQVSNLVILVSYETHSNECLSFTVPRAINKAHSFNWIIIAMCIRLQSFKMSGGHSKCNGKVLSRRCCCCCC